MTSADQLLRERSRSRPLATGILLFPDVEVLDFAGPFEVFSVASRVALRDRLCPHPPFAVSTIAAVPRLPVVARHGLQVVPSCGFADAPALDLLIVPGGVVTQPMGDRATLAWLEARAAAAALTASVCTGAFLLAKIGLLKGRRATTHWEDIDEFEAAFPDLSVVRDVAFVDEGSVVTSAGISAGIDMSLHLVARILGRHCAQVTARQMQYEWNGGSAADVSQE